MDPREREFDPEETWRMAFEGAVSGCWFAMPGLFQGFTNNGATCEVQPAINGRVRQRDGTYLSIQIPKLADVPVVWMGGGGATWTFGLVPNKDEGLIVFASRCIDQWFNNGFQTPTGQLGADGNPVNRLNDPHEFRIHSIADGFFIPGLRNKTRAFGALDAGVARLRTDDDSSYIEFNPTAKSVRIAAPGGVNINGAVISAAGEVTDAAGKVLGTHTHPDPQGGNVGPPN